MEKKNEEASTPKNEENQSGNDKDLNPKDQPRNDKITPVKQEKTKKLPWWIWAIITLFAILLIAFAFNSFNQNREKETEEKIEQTDPAPPSVVTIELQRVDGTFTWDQIPTEKQKLLKKTTNPDLQGEKVLLVYLISEPLFGDMYWIQTDPGDGTVRNIFTYPANVKIVN